MTTGLTWMSICEYVESFFYPINKNNTQSTFLETKVIRTTILRECYHGPCRLTNSLGSIFHWSHVTIVYRILLGLYTNVSHDSFFTRIDFHHAPCKNGVYLTCLGFIIALGITYSMILFGDGGNSMVEATEIRDSEKLLQKLVDCYKAVIWPEVNNNKPIT